MLPPSTPLPCLQDAHATATTHAVLVYVFKTVLKLLHPYMPFVTEELWQAMPRCVGGEGRGA